MYDLCVAHHVAEVLEEALADRVIAAEAYQLECSRIVQINRPVLGDYVLEEVLVFVQNVFFHLAQLNCGFVAQTALITYVNRDVSVQIRVEPELFSASRASKSLWTVRVVY